VEILYHFRIIVNGDLMNAEKRLSSWLWKSSRGRALGGASRFSLSLDD
jgi:hypothetical protein